MWQYSNSKTMRRLLIKLFTKGSIVCLHVISDSRKMDYPLVMRNVMPKSHIFLALDWLKMTGFGQKWPFGEQYHMVWITSNHNSNLNARFESFLNSDDSLEWYDCVFCALGRVKYFITFKNQVLTRIVVMSRQNEIGVWFFSFFLFDESEENLNPDLTRHPNAQKHLLLILNSAL